MELTIIDRQCEKAILQTIYAFLPERKIPETSLARILKLELVNSVRCPIYEDRWHTVKIELYDLSHIWIDDREYRTKITLSTQ